MPRVGGKLEALENSRYNPSYSYLQFSQVTEISKFLEVMAQSSEEKKSRNWDEIVEQQERLAVNKCCRIHCKPQNLCVICRFLVINFFPETSCM